MSENVQFEENEVFRNSPNLLLQEGKPSAVEGLIIKIGLAKNAAGVSRVLTFLALICFLAAIFVGFRFGRTPPATLSPKAKAILEEVRKSVPGEVLINVQR
jgi:uncharacterized membrane protein YtjA (UPF0391 family)